MKSPARRFVMTSDPPLPERIDSEEQLDEVLTRPSAALVKFVRTLPSPLLILGAGGKMGPSLAVLVKRAAEVAGHSLDVVAASRFSNNELHTTLARSGVKTLTCDLLDHLSLPRLPDAPNILYLVGLKFGTVQNPAATWAINTIVPTRVAERYPGSRIVALSTGNVYPLSEVSRGGSLEGDSLTPLGEYANAAVGRERIFEYHSCLANSPIALVRLFYAVELRYGVLVDLARRVYEGVDIDVTNGYFNCIWQGDANELIVRALGLAASPPSSWNLCRPEIYSVRAVAVRFGELFGRAPSFTGQELPTALLGNSNALSSQLGRPEIALETMISWIAGWVKSGGRDLGKPTHFEARDGRY
jgi:hypothetical protein